jgi:hypothetical protein
LLSVVRFADLLAYPPVKRQMLAFVANAHGDMVLAFLGYSGEVSCTKSSRLLQGARNI